MRSWCPPQELKKKMTQPLKPHRIDFYLESPLRLTELYVRQPRREMPLIVTLDVCSNSKFPCF